jgi:SMODS and SLOG-associating 2TM effector domain 2
MHAVRTLPTDLKSVPFPSLSWAPADRAKSLNALVGYATSEAERAIDWYYWKRRRMQRWGRGLRLGAVLATSAAGVTPLIAELMERNGHPVINPLWAALLLTMAGILVLLDRFWGCTSAWVRYMLAAQEVAAALDAFRMECESHKLAWDGDEVDVEQAQAMIDGCKVFLGRVRSVVRTETDTWATEFHKILEQIESAARPRPSTDLLPPR